MGWVGESGATRLRGSERATHSTAGSGKLSTRSIALRTRATGQEPGLKMEGAVSPACFRRVYV